MAQLIPFTPSPLVAFQSQVTLDADIYIFVVTWNVFGQRWYITVTTQDGERVFTMPLIGSPPEADISLTAGYFNSTMVFRQDTQTFEVTP